VCGCLLLPVWWWGVSAEGFFELVLFFVAWICALLCWGVFLGVWFPAALWFGVVGVWHSRRV